MKYISILITFLLVFSLVGCAHATSYTEATTSSVYSAFIYQESDKCFKVSAMGHDLEADAKQSNTFRAILNTLEWEENADWDSYDYWFNDGEIYIRYDSNKGILYDSTNNKHAILSGETNNEIKTLVKELTFLQSRPDVIE